MMWHYFEFLRGEDKGSKSEGMDGRSLETKMKIICFQNLFEVKQRLLTNNMN